MTAGPALSQEGRERGLTPQEFGTTEEVTYNLNPSDFQVRGALWPNASLARDGNLGVTSGSDVVFYAAPIHLPAGVRITSVRLYYLDTYPGSEPVAALERTDTGAASEEIVGFSLPSFSGGYSFVDGLLGLGSGLNVIDNENYHYSFTVMLSRSVADPAQRQDLVRVRIRYLRQVSPAPLSATFNDVSTSHPQHRFIEALVAAGITAGCGGGNYCPDAPITRGQMAVFLSAALGLQWPVSP